jgi:hypothetical protein
MSLMKANGCGCCRYFPHFELVSRSISDAIVGVFIEFMIYITVSVISSRSEFNSCFDCRSMIDINSGATKVVFFA